jgi:hypothetical protein
MRSPLLMLLRESGPVTLDDWLSASDCDDTFDAELLEVVPSEFRAEYESRLRLNSELNRKFEQQRTGDVLVEYEDVCRGRNDD